MAVAASWPAPIRADSVTHGLGTGDPLVQPDFELHAELLADRLRLAHHLRRQLARGRKAADVLQRGVGQRADRIEAEVAPQLQPDFRADIRQDGRLEAGVAEALRQGAHALGVGAVDLAERKAVAFDHADHARRVELGGRVDDAAERTLDRQAGRDNAAGVHRLDAAAFIGSAVLVEVPPGNAVLRRDHQGVRPDQRHQVGYHRGDLVRLHAQDHHVLHAEVGHAVAGCQARHFPAAVGLDECHAVGAHRLQVGAADHHAYLFADAGQTHGQIAADGAGAGHTDFHGGLLGLVARGHGDLTTAPCDSRSTATAPP